MQQRIVEAIDNALIISRTVARQLAPVDTGYMRAHIEIKKHPRYGSLIGTLESEAYYSVYVEYGTVNQVAQPFMHPAIAEGRKMFLRETRDVLK